MSRGIKDEFFTKNFFTVHKEESLDESKEKKETKKIVATQGIFGSIKSFFGIQSEENNFCPLGFPMPKSPEQLEAFLKKNGKAYRQGIEQILKGLKEWAEDQKNQKYPLSALVTFYNRNFLKYGKGTHFIVFELYTQGIYYLFKVNELLRSEKIPFDVRNNTFKNLLEEITACPPGTATNILNAYLSLVGDLAAEFTGFRRHIAEQTVIAKITKVSYDNDYYVIDDQFLLYKGNVMHCVNAVLNHYADQLAIKTNKDAFQNAVHEALIEYLVKQFEYILPASITLGTLVDWIINRKLTNLSELKKRLANGYKQEIVDSFEAELNHFGMDEQFNFNLLLKLGDDSITYSLNTYAEDFLKITLVTRLRNSKYIDFSLFKTTVNTETYCLVTTNDCHHPEYSYLEVNKLYNGYKTKELIPAIPYFQDNLRYFFSFFRVENYVSIPARKRIFSHFIKSSPDKIFSLFPRSEKISSLHEFKGVENKYDEQQKELVGQLITILNDGALFSLFAEDIVMWKKLGDVLSLLPNQCQLNVMVQSPLYISMEFFKARVNKLITCFDDIIFVLNSNQPSHLWSDVIFHDINKDHVSSLIKSPEHLLFLASQLPSDLFIIVINFIGAERSSRLIVCNLHLGKILHGLSQINGDMVLNMLGADYLKTLCNKLSDFVDMINACGSFNSKYVALLGEQHIHKVFENGSLWLEGLKLLSDELRWDYIYGFPSKLPKSQIRHIEDLIEILKVLKFNDCRQIRKLFKFFDEQYVSNLFGSISDLKKTILCLPPEIQGPLLADYFGIEFIQNLLPHVVIKLDNDDNLIDVINNSDKLEKANIENLIAKMIMTLNNKSPYYIFLYLLMIYISGEIVELDAKTYSFYGSIAIKICINLCLQVGCKAGDFKPNEAPVNAMEIGHFDAINKELITIELDSKSHFSLLLNIYFSFFPYGFEKLTKNIKDNLNPNSVDKSTLMQIKDKYVPNKGTLLFFLKIQKAINETLSTILTYDDLEKCCMNSPNGKKEIVDDIFNDPQKLGKIIDNVKDFKDLDNFCKKFPDRESSILLSYLSNKLDKLFGVKCAIKAISDGRCHGVDLSSVEPFEVLKKYADILSSAGMIVSIIPAASYQLLKRPAILRIYGSLVEITKSIDALASKSHLAHEVAQNK